ncbi:hypothetical protein [Marinibactrum halimedae]|uniref:Uncharacterized protein n=1 Tax=Marinibactrum halimedae TaxID=1444977 RepID=A0AA37T977_9GAMM|nr:hypothetical protein [Marinibactrum halimedae]MCD9458069.1 hypothetical protein [Marinibactrum halimedae]GLS25002.1 hypothetical protein GCM10007877_07160 [Marinibactrum halimedae]
MSDQTNSIAQSPESHISNFQRSMSELLKPTVNSKETTPAMQMPAVIRHSLSSVPVSAFDNNEQGHVDGGEVFESNKSSINHDEVSVRVVGHDGKNHDVINHDSISRESINQESINQGELLHGALLWQPSEHFDDAQKANYGFFAEASQRLADAFAFIEQYPHQGVRCFSGMRFSECPALDTLAHKLNLNEIEQKLLLLCVLVQCDVALAEKCKQLTDHPFISLSLAAKLMNDGQVISLTGSSPLRYWQLIQIEDTRRVQHSALYADEHILHYVLGKESVMPLLMDLLQPVRPAQRFLESQRLAGIHLFRLISQSRRRVSYRPSQLMHCAGDLYREQQIEACEVIAYQVVSSLKGQLLKFKTQHLPKKIDEVRALALQMQRQSLLHQHYYLIEIDSPETPLLCYFLQQLTQPVTTNQPNETEAAIVGLPNFCFVMGALPEGIDQDRYVSVNVGVISDNEKATVWQQALSKQGWEYTEEDIQRLLNEFSLTARGLSAVITHLSSKMNMDTPALGSGADNKPSSQPSLSELWQACHQQNTCVVQARPNEIESAIF